MTAGRVVVTGACGYIGSVLVPLLQEAQGVEELVLLDNLSNGSPRHLLDSDVGADHLSFARGDI
jgi:UDP-glucose 4-epimerase